MCQHMTGFLPYFICRDILCVYYEARILDLKMILTPPNLQPIYFPFLLSSLIVPSFLASDWSARIILASDWPSCIS